MHEMSIAINLLEIAEMEAQKQGCSKLLKLCVEYGAIAGIMPEALSLAFDLLIKDTPHENAKLELVCLPLKLRCSSCGATFGGEDQSALWMPCPQCGDSFGHIVDQGKELLLKQLEASKD